jgi:hypothetical protein
VVPVIHRAKTAHEVHSLIENSIFSHISHAVMMMMIIITVIIIIMTVTI